MVKGLNELHKRKIIHRDFKSANIFLMKKGICKLGDLYVAKLVENVYSPHRLVLLILPLLKYRKINLIILKVIYGVLDVYCIKWQD